LRNFREIPEFVYPVPREAGTDKLQIAMKTIPVSLILAGLLAPFCAHAQSPDDAPPPPGREGPGKRPHHRPFAEAWKKADTDGDGLLSRAEFSAMPRIQNLPADKHQKLFDRLDKNQDGKLTPAELYRHERQPDGPRQPAHRLAELDVDKSGGVSFEEFKAGPLFQKLPAERQTGIFRRLDTDGDGVITPKDKPEPPKRPEGGVRPKRGDGPPPEGPGPDANRMNPQRMLQQLDKDGDGAVTFDEFRAGPQAKRLSEDEQEDRFEAMDRNKDRKLTPEDFPAAPPRRP
jgi:Ca2+-binding EF-hand superfamily protein